MAADPNALSLNAAGLPSSDPLAGGMKNLPDRSSLSLRAVSLSALAVVEIPLLAVIVTVLVISLLITPETTLRGTGIDLPIPEASPWFLLTGIPCLFCGLTRSFLAMGGLDIGQAFVFHPLGPFLYTMMLTAGILLAFSIGSRRRLDITISSALSSHLIRGSVIVLILAWALKIYIWRWAGLL